jgi:adenylate cyclase
MAAGGVTRRPTAILAADVAGYSGPMEQNFGGTVAARQAARARLIDPAIAKHRGGIVKHTGDGFLAEFPTVHDAVKCGVAMQESLRDSPLDIRMRVNLSDIIDNGEDMQGAGVNIAVRIAAIAESGGIQISGGAYD